MGTDSSSSLNTSGCSDKVDFGIDGGGTDDEGDFLGTVFSFTDTDGVSTLCDTTFLTVFPTSGSTPGCEKRICTWHTS